MHTRERQSLLELVTCGEKKIGNRKKISFRHVKSHRFFARKKTGETCAFLHVRFRRPNNFKKNFLRLHILFNKMSHLIFVN